MTTLQIIATLFMAWVALGLKDGGYPKVPK